MSSAIEMSATDSTKNFRSFLKRSWLWQQLWTQQRLWRRRRGDRGNLICNKLQIFRHINIKQQQQQSNILPQSLSLSISQTHAITQLQMTIASINASVFMCFVNWTSLTHCPLLHSSFFLSLSFTLTHTAHMCFLRNRSVLKQCVSVSMCEHLYVCIWSSVCQRVSLWVRVRVCVNVCEHVCAWVWVQVCKREKERRLDIN